MAEQQDDNGPMYSRTPGRDIFGDLDDRIPEFRVPAEVKLDATRAAHKLGLDLSAYLRLNLYASLYGAEHVANMHKALLDRVLGNVPIEPDAEQSATVVGIPRFLRGTSR